MSIERFEEIEAWQEARKLCNSIFEISTRSGLSKDFSLQDQLKKATVSIMANIAEGFGSDSNKEFIRFLNYANRSVFEVQSHLYVVLDRGYINKVRFNELYEDTTTTRKLIGGFIRYLKNFESEYKD